MTISEKLLKIAENEQKVYQAGKKSMIDESKIIEKTVSGSVISLDDVSEVPHEVSVQLSSDTVTDFSGVVVNVFKKNLINGNNVALNSTKNQLTVINDTTFSITPDASDGKIYGIYFRDLGLQVGDTINCSVKSITKIGTTFGWRFTYADGTNGTLYQSLSFNMVLEKDVKYLSLYCDMGTADFSYEPVTFTDVVVYKETEATRYIANADGTVSGVKSISPYMTITPDTADVNITATYHKSFGMQTEHDRFWNNFQNFGNRTAYNNAFQNSWPDAIFKPKYDIRPTAAGYMFAGTQITNLKKCLEDSGVVLDLSLATSVDRLFSDAPNLTYCPAITITNAPHMQNLFYNCKKLISVDMVTIKSDGSQPFNDNSFNNCTSLVEIRFGGVIGNSINFRWSKNLSMASLDSILTALSTTPASGATITFPTTAEATYDAATISGSWDMRISTIQGYGWAVKYA